MKYLKKPHYTLLLILNATFVAMHTQVAMAQEQEITDLLAGEAPAKFAIAGDWKRTGSGLQVAAQSGARIALAAGVPDDYEVAVEFTRTSGDDCVALILPVGEASPALELSAWAGEAHGLSRVDESSAKAETNPTSVRPGLLENGKRYRLEVAVRASGESASVVAMLDGKSLIEWSGKTSRLQRNFAINLPAPRTFGLASQNNDVTFHRVEMRASGLKKPPVSRPEMAGANPGGESATDPSSGTGPSVRVPGVLAGAVDLSGLARGGAPGWELFNGAEFEASLEGELPTMQSKPDSGAGDRGAYLRGVEFSEGTIQIDLRGAAQPQSSFLGVVFHGEDGETYDSVYFRPFNFRGARRGNAVQYMSHPDFPWNKLRSERPGEFESAASPEPSSTDWFRARIEVGDGRVKVFVNDADQPCLDVEKLGKTNKGKVGLWFNGVASFGNLKIEPAK